MALRTPKAPLLKKRIKAYMALHDKSPEYMARNMHLSKSAWYRRYKDPGVFTLRELEMLELITGMVIIAKEEEK